MFRQLRRTLVIWTALMAAAHAFADASGPALASHYDSHMALVDGVAYGWTGRDEPRMFRAGVIQAMAQGKRISADIDGRALQAIKDMGAAARLARTSAGEGQAVAAARLGVHVQTIARIESGEPGVAIGHVLGMLALYGVTWELRKPEDDQRAS